LGKHRSTLVQLEEAVLHVNIQLPNPQTRVQYLLENIDNNDPDLRAFISSIRINTYNMRDDFEKYFAFLLTVGPFVKNISSSIRKPRLTNVSSKFSSSTLKNSSDSNTGVDFLWHTPKEYMKLSNVQKSELYDWKQFNEGKAQIKKYHNTKKATNK